MKLATISAMLLLGMTQAVSADDIDDSERACALIHDYAVRASRTKRWPPSEHAERRLRSLYDRCSANEEACASAREELQDRGFDDGQLNCRED